ncbi:hypothetical protein, partial [Acinetobacter baumannii]|uniref:hypothetical protein n=1 Tax=Acinetobacter baumannii TaxID=470 RepID=UPI002090D768
IPTNSPKNDFTLKVPTMEGIHLLYLEINKIFSLSCQPICNSAFFSGLLFKSFAKPSNTQIKVVAIVANHRPTLNP